MPPWMVLHRPKESAVLFFVLGLLLLMVWNASVQSYLVLPSKTPSGACAPARIMHYWLRQRLSNCESINGWIAIPMVRCGICAVSTLRMCFYACRISLISGLLNEDLICWVGS